MEVANKLPKASNEDMLELYGWFKQANVGDVNTGASVPGEPARFIACASRPRSATDRRRVASPLRRPPRHVRHEGKAKWDAWKKREGTSKEDAMKKYCEVVKRLSA